MNVATKPWYVTFAGTPAKEIWNGDWIALVCSSIWPAGMDGVTGPNPTPYKMIVWPGWARAVGTAEVRPGGRIKVTPSGRSAATYWPAFVLNADGASKPGSSGFTFTM